MENQLFDRLLHLYNNEYLSLELDDKRKPKYKTQHTHRSSRRVDSRSELGNMSLK